MRSPLNPPPSLSSSRVRPPKKNAILAINVIAVAIVAAIELMRMSPRYSLCSTDTGPTAPWSVLADSLRTDRPAFRRVQVDHPLIIQIRALSRAEDDLQVDLGRLTNRAREQVYRLAPGLLTLCPAANESWFWTLLEVMMSPSRLTRHRIEKLLHDHRIRRLTADEVFVPADRGNDVTRMTGGETVVAPR